MRDTARQMRSAMMCDRMRQMSMCDGMDADVSRILQIFGRTDRYRRYGAWVGAAAGLLFLFYVLEITF